MKWIIVYPCGNRNKIAIAQAYPYEVSEYALASRQSFYSEKEAAEYAIELAETHGKICEINGQYKVHDYLD
jgi:hypothetical protein